MAVLQCSHSGNDSGRKQWGFAKNPQHRLLMKETPADLRSTGTLELHGAGEMNRTPDLLITNELLYRLSYTGFPSANYNGQENRPDLPD